MAFYERYLVLGAKITISFNLATASLGPETYDN